MNLWSFIRLNTCYQRHWSSGIPVKQRDLGVFKRQVAINLSILIWKDAPHSSDEAALEFKEAASMFIYTKIQQSASYFCTRVVVMYAEVGVGAYFFILLL